MAQLNSLRSSDSGYVGILVYIHPKALTGVLDMVTSFLARRGSDEESPRLLKNIRSV